MTIINTHFHKSDFYHFEDEDFLVVKDKDNQVDSLSLNRFALQIGAYCLKILKFNPSKHFFMPVGQEVESTLAKLGLHFNESEIITLKKGLKPDNLHLVFNRFLNSLNVQSSLGLNLDSPTLTIIAISRSPILPVSVAPFDPLEKLKLALDNPKGAHEAYKSRYVGGSFDYITCGTITKISKIFFEHLPAFSKIINSPQPLDFVEFTDDSQVIATKSDGYLKLCWILKDFTWRGAYKSVMLGACISDAVHPCGISSSEDEVESMKEISLRKDPKLKRLFTSLHTYWSSVRQYNFIHGWASLGSLDSVNFGELSLAEKDDLALQLIEKMYLLHQEGVHKDLNTYNILVNRQDSRLELYINDLGSFARFDQENELKLVKTNSVHLSPELLKKALAYRGLYWADIFSVPSLTKEDWIQSEKFQIGCILYDIYQGHHPFFSSLDYSAIEAIFPLASMSFQDILKDPLLSYGLLDYADDVGAKLEHKLHYRIAFDTLTENATMSDLSHTLLYPGYTLDPAPCQQTPFAGMTFLDFESTYVDPAKRIKLEPFLGSSLDKIKNIYKYCYKKMLAQKTKAMLIQKASCIVSLDQETVDGLSSSHIKIQKRLSVIKKLLEIDPTKRPDLDELRHELQVAQFLYP